VLAAYSGRILPIDISVATAWAKLPARRTLPAFDSLIAATALAHGLTVATRNVKDFTDAEVPVFNPFESAQAWRS
jgi:predicted nucleic acid-binding protein